MLPNVKQWILLKDPWNKNQPEPFVRQSTGYTAWWCFETCQVMILITTTWLASGFGLAWRSRGWCWVWSAAGRGITSVAHKIILTSTELSQFIKHLSRDLLVVFSIIPRAIQACFFLDVRQCCVKKTWDLRSSVSECWSQICRKLSTNLELSHCPNSISPLRSAVTDLRLLRHWDETVSLGHGSPESPSAFTDSSESHHSPSIHSVASEATHPVSLSRDLWSQASCTQAAGLWGSQAVLLQPA